MIQRRAWHLLLIYIYIFCDPQIVNSHAICVKLITNDVKIERDKDALKTLILNTFWERKYFHITAHVKENYIVKRCLLFYEAEIGQIKFFYCSWFYSSGNRWILGNLVPGHPEVNAALHFLFLSLGIRRYSLAYYKSEMCKCYKETTIVGIN